MKKNNQPVPEEKSREQIKKELLELMKKHILKIKADTLLLKDQDIVDKINQLEAVTSKLLVYIDDELCNLKQTSKLVMIYLPMTLKLIDSFIILEKAEAEKTEREKLEQINKDRKRAEQKKAFEIKADYFAKCLEIGGITRDDRAKAEYFYKCLVRGGIIKFDPTRVNKNTESVKLEPLHAIKEQLALSLDDTSEAFMSLLDSYFENITNDISSDISVLKTMLLQDGLYVSPFDLSHKKDDTTV